MSRFLIVLIAALSSACATWERDDLPSSSEPRTDDPGFWWGGRESGPPPDAGPPPPSLEGPAVSAENPPPVISGGTLLALSDGTRLVASDPDRDRVLVVSTTELAVTGTLALDDGDEPGRVVEDASSRVHVVLRGGGAIVSFDPADPATATRREVCPMPRGIAFEASSGNLHVACRGGELVTLPAAGGAPVRTLRLDRDLRDVIAMPDGLFVTRFRSAEVLRLGPTGTVVSRNAPQTADGSPIPEGELPRFEPGVAWRTAALPGGGLVMTHQRATSATVEVERGGYGGAGMCRGGGIVHSALTVISPEGVPSPGAALSFVTLPVDVAVDGTGGRLAVVAAARNELIGNVLVYTMDSLATSVDCAFAVEEHAVEGDAIAVAFGARDQLWVQTREPATIVDPRSGPTIMLGGEPVTDTGHRIFHLSSGAFLACASCHPEGGDDGRVWTFAGLGPRRTQTMEGGILGSEPFHWSGDMNDLGELAHEVLTGRMSGPELRSDQVDALGRWLDSIPAPAPSVPTDAAAVARGEALFHDTTVGCATCHSGPLLSNNTTVDVGTGELLQVPRLVGISARAPYMHTGCAPTLADRFGPCGGGDRHGRTSHLTPAQLDDLVAYLETL